jgi:hypothetical protein
MDAYLDRHFRTYEGVPKLIEWCGEKGILFMINTTGFLGYFQRVFSRSLLPKIPVLSANPLIRYPSAGIDMPETYALREIEDKGRNTAAAVKAHGLRGKNIVLIGDSGGDGPHFGWGTTQGAFKIGSMAKRSLIDFCKREKIVIDHFFGPIEGDAPVDGADPEPSFDFMELTGVLERVFRL